MKKRELRTFNEGYEYAIEVLSNEGLDDAAEVLRDDRSYWDDEGDDE